MSMHFPADTFVQEERKRESSPFAGVDLGRTSLPQDVQFRVEAGLAEPWPNTEKARVGKLLACAIWHGALLARNFWPQWINALDEGLRFGSSLWFEMAPLDPTQAGTLEGHPRRWFADPLSQILILRWRQLTGVARLDGALDAEECLASYLDPLGSHGASSPLIDGFYRAAVMRWRCRMPAVLVETALGHADTFTSTPATWERLMTGAPIWVDAPQKTPPTAPIRWHRRIWRGDCDLHFKMKAIFTAATKDDPILSKRQQQNRAVRELQALSGGGNESDVSVLMRRWCIAMLTEDLQASGKRGYRPGSAWNYMFAFRREILPPGSPGEFGDLSAADLDECYREALARLPEGHRRNHLINAIQAFQRFAVIERPELALPTGWMNAFRSNTDGAINLISSRDYFRALAALPDRAAHDIRMLRICLILGFRTGLRLPEIRALTIDDVCVQGAAGAEHIELVVRNRRHNRTKTDWSRRVLPLHLLLARSEDVKQCEVSEFLSWFRDGERLSALTGCSTLFVNPDRPIERVRHGTLEYPLNDILRRATGDATVSFGTLRHSFLSCMLATLLLPDDGTSIALPAGLDANSVSQDRKERVGPALMGEERIGQAALHAVSQLAGHAPVETTLRHYAHLLDWVVGAFVCRPSVQLEWTVDQAHNLTGLTTSAIRTAVQDATAVPVIEEQSLDESYRRPTLIRSQCGKGYDGRDPQLAVFADVILKQATRAALIGAPTFRTTHYPFQSPRLPYRSRRGAGIDWLNWRMVKAVLDVDCRGMSLNEASEQLDIPVEWACRWAKNRQRFRLAWSVDVSRRLALGDYYSVPPDRALPSMQCADGASRHRQIVLDMNFPRAPTASESLIADLIWSRALRCASGHLQRGLLVFRDAYDRRCHSLTAANWSEAHAFYDVARLLGFDDDMAICHRPETGGRCYTDQLRGWLTNPQPPSEWHGQVQFRFLTGTAPGRGYGLRFALTILTITDAELLAEARAGERPRYVPCPEEPTICVLSWMRRRQESESWSDFSEY